MKGCEPPSTEKRQATAAIKRVMVYFYGGEGYRDRVEYPIEPAVKNVFQLQIVLSIDVLVLRVML